ncbi:MFS transporter [Chromobacterium vaccinii]|uniref:MFS transporter n=1 Tax=Chromobacterium vaccinii TaxID=1108595 RepID=A0ABV0FKW2_9NEIS
MKMIKAWCTTLFPSKTLGSKFVMVQLSGFLLMLASEFERLSVAWWCLDKTKSPAMFATMVTVGSIGYLAAQPSLGWLGDRYPKRNVLISSFSISAAASLILAALSNGIGFPAVAVGVTLLVGSLATSIVPALMSGVVLDLVDKSNVTDAFRVRASLGTIASTGGPILAGSLIAFFGYKWPILIASILVLLAVIGLARNLPKHEKLAENLISKGPRKFFQDWLRMTSYGAKSVWMIKPERQMGFLAMITNAAMLPMVLVLIPSLVKQYFSNPAWISGLASASLGLGVLACSTFILPKIKTIKTNDYQIILGRLLSAGGVCGTTISVAAFGYTSSTHLATSLLCLSLFVAGVGLGLVNIVGSSVRSRAIPPHLRTRIFAATGFLSGIAIPFGNLLQGVALNTMGPFIATLTISIIMCISVVIYLQSDSIRSIMRCSENEIDGEYGRRYEQFAAEEK